MRYLCYLSTMNRIKLELPAAQHFIFTTEITPRINDINYGNHLGHDHIISLMHEARLRFLEKYNFSELDVAGVSIIMADLAITYKAEVSWGERLTFDIAVYAPSSAGCNFFYYIKTPKMGPKWPEPKPASYFLITKRKKSPACRKSSEG